MGKKILLIRFSSIGDIVLTSPVIRCMKMQLHDAEIHILTKRSNQQLFEVNPYITKIHSYDNNFDLLINQLKDEDFDHIVDLHKNLRSFRVKLALRKPATSFSKLNLKKYLLVRFKLDLLPRVHIVDRYFEAVKQLGVQNDGRGLDYFIPDNESINPGDFFPMALSGYYAIVVGGKHNTKLYPVEKLIQTCQALQKPMILLGDTADAKRADALVAALNGRAISLCGKLRLHQSASVLAQADAVLTNDTGLMHIAAALDKPIVSVWGSTVPELGMYPYVPNNQNFSIIIEHKDLYCRPCSKIGFDKCPKGHFKCMMDIKSDRVAKAMENIK